MVVLSSKGSKEVSFQLINTRVYHLLASLHVNASMSLTLMHDFTTELCYTDNCIMNLSCVILSQSLNQSHTGTCADVSTRLM